jgi:hypothetical protein
MRIIIFSTPACPGCKALKAHLDGQGIAYEEVDVTTAEGWTFMLTHDVYITSCPAMCVGKTLYQRSYLVDSKDNLLDLEGILHG